MIQTTKDADKAKTSQRQRVDDQNDRFVSRNRHHAPPPVALFWALFIHFFNAFPDLLRWRTARDRKRTGSVQRRGLAEGCFIPHTLGQNQYSPVLMAHDLGLGTQVRRYCYRSWLLSAVSRGGGRHGHLLNCPASAEVYLAQ